MLKPAESVSRRTVLKTLAIIAPGLAGFMPGKLKEKSLVMTVKGPIDPAAMGNTLIHEHILVDFIGADKIDPSGWNAEEVIYHSF